MVPAISHAPTRRDLVVGTGALFAWTQLPRLARAQGRDSRFLAIVLRGALDGLAVVAPVGDPQWENCAAKTLSHATARRRGCSSTPCLPSTRRSRACTNSIVTGTRQSYMRWRPPIATARISTGRMYCKRE